MKAIEHHRFGSPQVLELREIDRPEPAPDELLVRVHAASLNRAEWYTVTGRPYVGRVAMGLRRPKTPRFGVDFAGTVEAVGAGVTSFGPGDEVFGARTGALAEYVCVREERAVVTKPPNVTFEEAASVPVAALTALQGLRDKGGLEPGQKVLVNGASGGVGTFAVQIAKALGAEVTGVCCARNVELVRSLGADHVVDYESEDFTRSGERYDLLLDVAGSKPWRACKRVLAPDATVVLVGGPKDNRLLGPIGHVARMRIGSLGSGRKSTFFIAKLDKPDLEAMRELLESGQVRPAIDRTYGLAETAAALEYVGKGHARAKVVVTVAEEAPGDRLQQSVAS